MGSKHHTTMVSIDVSALSDADVGVISYITVWPHHFPSYTNHQKPQKLTKKTSDSTQAAIRPPMANPNMSQSSLVIRFLKILAELSFF